MRDARSGLIEMIYTAWGRDGRAMTLIEGEGPPDFSVPDGWKNRSDRVTIVLPDGNIARRERL